MNFLNHGSNVRPIIFLVVAVLLAGCETESGWIPHAEKPDSPPPPSAASVETAPLQAPPQRSAASAETTSPEQVARCHSVARQRAADARANGFSLEMEHAIFEGTLKDCLSWDAEHGE
jgi:hypothetical protein